MATRKPQPPPPAEGDPKRREWTAGAVRLWVALQLTDGEERMAWLIAWRRYDAGLGHCPITEGELRRAIAEYPDRATYAAVLTKWQGGPCT